MLQENAVAARTLELLIRLMRNEMLDAYCRKYTSVNPLIAGKAIAFFEDIDFNVPIELAHGSFKWKKVENRIKQMLRHPNRIFENIEF